MRKLLVLFMLLSGACKEDRCGMTADQKTDLVCVFEEQHEWAVEQGVIREGDRWYEEKFYSKLEDCRDSAMSYLADFIRAIHNADALMDEVEFGES